MSASVDTPASSAGDLPRHSNEARSGSSSALHASLHAALSDQRPDLATRWLIQSQEALLFDTLRSDRDGQAQSSSVAHDLVGAFLAALNIDDEEAGSSISAGLRFGMEAFTRGASLYHAAKAVDLLDAMVMRAMEKAAADSDVPQASAADGIWLARRLQARGALLSRAVLRGYIQAHEESLRDGFRHLRHDLRNPLGTIKSVLALMDDESVPVEARANPNFRAIAKRNAVSLEDMISNRLGDTATPLSAMASQEAFVQSVAEIVRRELGAEALRQGVTVLIEPTELRGRFDTPGLELLLRDTLYAALRESHTGEEIHLEIGATGANRAEVRLSREPQHALLENRSVIDRLTALARMIGASVTFADHVVIAVPIRIADRGTHPVPEQSVLRGPVGSGVVETPHDLRRPREDDHGEASVL